jgi:hypothetical protein
MDAIGGCAMVGRTAITLGRSNQHLEETFLGYFIGRCCQQLVSYFQTISTLISTISSEFQQLVTEEILRI